MRVLPFLVLLAACGAPPAATTAVPRPETPPPLLRAALEEWTAWGRITVEGFPDTRPPIATTPDRFARLTAYWRAVPSGPAVANRLEALRGGVQDALAPEPEGEGDATPVAVTDTPVEDIGIYARPAWSAAFISYVAGRAGLDLPPSATHARYVDALLSRALTDPAGAAFLPLDPSERAPRSGDLLCADRAFTPLLHWRDRVAEEGVPRPMHCDVVVRAAPGVVEMVGGNVSDVVALRRLPADREGRVLPAPIGKPQFFLLLAARG